jgi:hypothetical protein
MVLFYEGEKVFRVGEGCSIQHEQPAVESSRDLDTRPPPPEGSIMIVVLVLLVVRRVIEDHR